MYTEHTQTQLLSQPLTHTHAHREDKLLSQHPQIRLHVTFPIRGFLERLNPECGEIPASKAEHRLIFLSVGSECWLAGGSATLIPDFHKIRGRAASTAAAAAAANYRCDEHTYAYAHIHTDAPSPHTHTHACPKTYFSRLKLSKWREPSSPPLLQLPSLVFSHLRQEGTCQRMLSSPASQSSQRWRERDNKWAEREPIKILISLSEEEGAPATDGS